MLISRYDAQHNIHLYKKNTKLVKELHDFTIDLCKLYFPLKHQIDREIGIQNSIKSLLPLLKKIQNDLLWWQNEKTDSNIGEMINEFCFKQHGGLNPNFLEGQIKSAWRHVRTRLYFTSSAHIYSLFNLLGKENN
jgi:inositol hexakisphosphate/diphosphoinositol-pentakisphosphate kinase